jgi:hypothetical protein
MRTIAVVTLAVAALAAASPLHAAIDRFTKEDPARFGVGILHLYYNICKGLLDYGKTVVVTAPDLPKAVATDIFQVGQKRVPEAYYMTEREKQERDRQDKLQERLERQKKKEEGMSGLMGSGAKENRPPMPGKN